MALNIENIIAEIKEASILELNDLVKAIEEEVGGYQAIIYKIKSRLKLIYCQSSLLFLEKMSDFLKIGKLEIFPNKTFFM